MSGYVDSRQKEILWDLLANPADNGSSYIQSLERLVQDNPQSGLLQVLLARAGDKTQLSKATVYYNPRTLHKIFYRPEDLAVVNDASIIHSTGDFYTTAQKFFNVGNAQAKPIDAGAFYNNTYDTPAQQEGIVADEPIIEPVLLDDTDAFNNGYKTADQQEVVVADEPVSEPLQVIEAQEEAPIQVIDEPEVTEEVAQVPVDNYEQTGVETPALAADDIEEEPFEEPAETPVLDTPEEVAALVENNEPEKVVEHAEPEPVVEEPQAVEQMEAVAEQPIEPTPPHIPQYEAPRFNARFPKPGAQNTTAPEPVVEQPKQDIEDEVYDEIVGIEDIGFEHRTAETPAEPVAEARFSEPHIDSGPEEEEASAVLFHQPQPVVEPLQDGNKHIQEQEERLIMGSAIGADYLTFDKKLDELRGVTNNSAPVKEAPQAIAIPEPQQQPIAQLAEHTEQQVSRYDDDKMPYSFMWWLNKTRKEHAGSFQPYANVEGQQADAKQASQETANLGGNVSGNELQQQYYANIFSHTSVSGVERGNEPGKVEFDPAKKEDVIIERFIHTEPQIKPLSADRLDNENKAKKSSEDLNDFVTETLARIYCDQMLYHKAIATYKKLILKFPEKKLYFAAQIEQLENKTN